jgi:CRP-like cAMP-binding protein
LTGAPRTATVSALSQVELVSLDRSSFLDVLQKHPEIRDRIDLEAHNRHDQLVTKQALCGGESQASQNLDDIKNILKENE